MYTTFSNSNEQRGMADQVVPTAPTSRLPTEMSHRSTTTQFVMLCRCPLTLVTTSTDKAWRDIFRQCPLSLLCPSGLTQIFFGIFSRNILNFYGKVCTFSVVRFTPKSYRVMFCFALLLFLSLSSHYVCSHFKKIHFKFDKTYFLRFLNFSLKFIAKDKYCTAPSKTGNKGITLKIRRPLKHTSQLSATSISCMRQ